MVAEIQLAHQEQAISVLQSTHRVVKSGARSITVWSGVIDSSADNTQFISRDSSQNGYLASWLSSGSASELWFRPGAHAPSPEQRLRSLETSQ